MNYLIKLKCFSAVPLFCLLFIFWDYSLQALKAKQILFSCYWIQDTQYWETSIQVYMYSIFCSSINPSLKKSNCGKIGQLFSVIGVSFHLPFVTLHRNLMLKVKARARHACTTRLACLRSRICAY